MQNIITPRLSLRLMTEEILEASLRDEREKAESFLGLQIPQDWFDEVDIMSIRLGQYRSDPPYIPWGLRAVGLRKSSEMVGFIGFHSRPDAEDLRRFAPNAVELGYVIFFSHRRCGYAQEAAMGLMDWAVRQYPLEYFIASISTANTASRALIEKLEFEKIGEQIDEADGLEMVYALAAQKVIDKRSKDKK